MSRLRVYRRKIEVYSSLKDITKAIQLVALARLNRLMYKLKNRQIQLLVIKKILQMKEFEFDFDRYLIILVTTDRSCCGMLNKKIFKTTMGLISIFQMFQKQIKFVIFGEKGKSFVRRRYPSLAKLYVTDLGGKSLSLLLVQSIVEYIMDSNKCIDAYIILYNRYINFIEHRISFYRVFSPHIVLAYIFSCIEENTKFSIFFNSIARLCMSNLSFFYEFYIFFFCLILLDALEENELSELSVRYRFMDNAHTHISAMLQSLIINYHKLRQETITRELIEIITAAESIMSDSH